MIDEKTIKKIVVIVSISILAILTAMIVWPIILSILIGLLLAYMFYPLYKRTFSIVKERNISSLLIMLLLFFLIFIPLWFFFPALVRQVFEVYSYVQKIDTFSLISSILPDTLSKDTSAMLNSFISHVVNGLFATSTNTLLNLPNLILQIFVVLFTFFFGMRDAEKLKDYLCSISPFSPELEHKLSKHFQDITKSVIYGYILVGLIQGILTGIGLFIFGISNTLLLTIIACIAAMLPVLGAWLVWIPASIYLLTSGHTGAGIGLILYGGVFVSWIDNFLRPYIVSRKTNLSSGIVLVGMIGGLMMFGFIGLLLGPLILAYLLVILDAYRNKELAKFFN